MINTCNQATNNRIISVAENRMTFTIYNNSLFLVNKVTVDNCYITLGLRCDYLFEIIDTSNNIKSVYYVELKGRDIVHAIEQLTCTLNVCRNIHNNIKKECYIVASKFPRSSPSSQVMKKDFLSKNKSQLFIDTTKREVKI
jgi:hypothetical protein